MKLTTSNRTFGIFFSVIFFSISAYLFFTGSNFFNNFFIFNILFLLLSLFLPDSLMILNKSWEFFGKIIHFVMNNILIFIIYFTVFTLIGLPMRLFGFDPFKKRKFLKSNSYWEKRINQPNPFIDMF